MPKVSIVMPVYNGRRFLKESVNSIINQTFEDWEFLIINDERSCDGTNDLLQEYADSDSRFKIFMSGPGITKALNIGLDNASGEYILRMDSDDIAEQTRIDKQVQFMDEHPEVGICGTDFDVLGENWKSNICIGRDLIKSDLLFFVSLRHPTICLRNSVVREYKLRYNENLVAAEDYDLFVRASEVTELANIPEKLLIYRRHPDAAVYRNLGKGVEVCKELLKKQLSKLGLKLNNREISLLCNHHMLSWDETNYIGGVEENISLLEELLLKIERANIQIGLYTKEALHKTLCKRWRKAFSMLNDTSFDYDHEKIYNIFKESSLSEGLSVNKSNRFKMHLKSGVKKICTPWKKLNNYLMSDVLWQLKQHVNDMTWDRYEIMDQKYDCKLWNLECKVDDLMCATVSQSYSINRVPYWGGEVIRIVFLIQVASFWPSMENLYDSMKGDERFDVKIICYDEEVDPSIKTETTREFLVKQGIDFIDYKEFNLESFNPHIVFLQTPYDSNRSPKYKSAALKENGYRVCYVPYGLEIADTEHSRKQQLDYYILKNCWKVYTFSEAIYEDFKKYSSYPEKVHVFGLPRFDALYNRDQFKLNEEIKRKAKGRKIVLFKVHFPKIINENGRIVLVTPDIREYIEFANHIEDFDDFFFVFMPHPRFKEFTEEPNIMYQTEELLDILNSKDNVYIDNSDDYRPSLVNADYIIVDRSAVMVEAGTVGVPVLYMFNKNFYEPMTDAIKPLINSYYLGTEYKDIVKFIEMCRTGKDPKKEIRETALKKCIPYFDGKCSERIKNDLYESILKGKNE